jgi:DNA-binding CsgD family transcriptional regulator
MALAARDRAPLVGVLLSLATTVDEWGKTVSGYQTKQTRLPKSQIFPSPPAKVASDVTLEGTYVGLCDWHGTLVWKSGAGVRLQVGEFIWAHASTASGEEIRTAVASVSALRENRTLEVESDQGDHFRIWMWPLNDPEIAICMLAMRIPSELALLTQRERACLQCLAQGKTTRDIASELEIGLTTVHTHLRRSREKLGLASGEALIGFAARYFFAPVPHGAPTTTDVRKRSG